MADPIAQKAARHSQAAFAMLSAARRLRSAAKDFDIAEEEGVLGAGTLRSEAIGLADRSDRARRAIMRRSPDPK